MTNLIPARFTLDLTAAVSDDDGMSVLWDRLHDALDKIPGVFSEGGVSELMDADDLIEDSPLDRYIKAHS
jgi:hypothetical protein